MNPLGPWNMWFAVSSQPARIWTGVLRGMAQGWAKADAETDRTVIENVGGAQTNIAAAASKLTKHRVAKEALAVPAKRGRRKRHRVRSGRVDHRVKKNRKRQPSDGRVRGQKYGSNVDERKSINAKRKGPPV
jgi:hypothetical protein